MPPLPRGTCRVCGADVALRKGGLVRQHAMRPSGRGADADNLFPCPGTGWPAVEVEGPSPGVVPDEPPA